MDNTKLFNDIKDVIIDLLVPHIKHVAQLGGGWNADSNASAFYWSCSNDASGTNSRIGASLCDNGDIEIWTKNKDNVTIVINLVKRKAFTGLYSVDVMLNTVADFDEFSKEEMKDLYNRIIDFYKEKRHAVMLSEEELSDQYTTMMSIRDVPVDRVICEKTLEEETPGNWRGYIKEQIVRTFDKSKFDIGKCYEVREIKQTNTELVFPRQCILQSVYDTQLVFLYLKEDDASSVFVFIINIQDIDNYEILKMFTTH